MSTVNTYQAIIKAAMPNYVRLDILLICYILNPFLKKKRNGNLSTSSLPKFTFHNFDLLYIVDFSFGFTFTLGQLRDQAW